MNWPIYQKQFESYLQLEKSLSGNSVEAYLNDLGKLRAFLEATDQKVDPAAVTPQHLQGFLQWVNELGMSATTQARILSGIRAFYKFLIMENLVTADPTENIEAPKLRRKLPDTLSFPEIEQLFAAIDVSKPEGARNKAMLETLYSSGLRVSELVDLKLSNFKLTRSGTLKLLDFGIAKGGDTPKLTREGHLVGTARSMAPEQFDGNAGPPADCWALGVLLYELLTGHPPFDGRTETEIGQKVKRGDYLAPSVLKPGLSKTTERLITKLLTGFAPKRYTAEQTGAALEKPALLNEANWVGTVKRWVGRD